MQVTKDYIKTNIQEAARKLFLDKGYADVSMREIAEKAQVGLSNIYNYFKNKDELFLIVVQPALEALHECIESTDHPFCQSLFTQGNARHYLINQYLSLIERFKPQISVLLFHAKGSSLEHFKESFTEKAAAKVKQYMEDQRKSYGLPPCEISDFALRLHIVWLFTLFEEAVKSDVTHDELEEKINEYILFETTDYRKLA